jgi:hypothetical protein
VQRLADAEGDDDVLLDALTYAIPAVGGADAVASLESRFPLAGDAFQAAAIECLGRIKHPAAEAALARLVARGERAHLAEHFAAAFADLLSAEAVPLLREIVLGSADDRRDAALTLDLVACALMTGQYFPELGLLRQEAIAEQIDRDRRPPARESDLDDDGHADPSDPHPHATAPIRNADPKVGRNDPCPCGSGKKYKKCCLGK